MDAGDGEDGDLYLFSCNGIDDKGYTSEERGLSSEGDSGDSSSEDNSSGDDGSDADDRRASRRRAGGKSSVEATKPVAKVRHYESPRDFTARL